MMLPIIVCGAAGRMGREIIKLLPEYPDFVLAGAIEAPGHPLLGQDAGLVAGARACGVPLVDSLTGRLASDVTIIDFSQPEATLAHLRGAVQSGAAIVIGTTGFSAAQEKELEQLAPRTRCFVSSNMSVGVAIILRLAELAATHLGAEYDVEIFEMHHRHKVDAPSGTALSLARAVAKVRGLTDSHFRFGRHGRVGPRPREEIGLLALRGGDVVGDHTLVFAGNAERIELVHRAQNREAFARGALRAAKWLQGQPPGRYSMREMLGL